MIRAKLQHTSTKTKKITLLTATAFAIGSMVGGGVFALTGVALKTAGPAAIVSFVVAGISVLVSALSFAVMASVTQPGASGYSAVGTILKRPLAGFVTSWCFYLGGIIGAAFVLNAFGSYMHEFVTPGMSIVVWALIGAAALTLVNLGPASAIGRIETWLVGGKLIILGILVVFGVMHFHASDLQPFSPHGTSSILVASGLLFIAFLGFNVITSISGDIENPRKTIPRAILLSMVIVTLVYLGVVIALLASGIHSYSEASVGVAAKQLIGPVGGGLVVIGALISTLSSANANILGSSEIIVRLASDKQIPTIFGRMTHGHPYISVFAGGLLYIVLVLSRQTETIIQLANSMALVALILVNIAAARALSNKHYDGFKLPLKWLFPSIGIVASLVQFVFIPWPALLVAAGLILLGIGVYALRGKYNIPSLHHKLVREQQTLGAPLARSLHH